MSPVTNLCSVCDRLCWFTWTESRLMVCDLVPVAALALALGELWIGGSGHQPFLHHLLCERKLYLKETLSETNLRDLKITMWGHLFG